MIDIFTSDTLKILYPKVKSFVESELYPIEMELLKQPFNEAEKILRQKRELAKKAGLWTPYLKKEQGGSGLSMLEFAQISEILATTPFGHYCLNCQAPDIGNIELLNKYGSEQGRGFVASKVIVKTLMTVFVPAFVEVKYMISIRTIAPIAKTRPGTNPRAYAGASLCRMPARQIG